MPALVFTVLWLLAILASSRLAFAALAGQALPVRLAGAMALLPVLVQFMVLAAGAIGSLTAPTLMVLSALLAAAALAWTRRLPAVPAPAAPAGALPLWAIGLAGALAGALLFRMVWLRQSYIVDDYSYHALAPAMWVQAKALVLAPPNYHAYYPFSPHTFSAWLMLPFHNDGLAALAGAYWLSLLGLVSYAIAVAGGARPGAALLAALCIPLANAAAGNSLTFVGVDVAGPAFVLASALMLLAARTAVRPLAAVMLAGAFAGFAVGGKISFAPMALALLLFTALRPDRLKSAPIFAVSAAVSGGYWYLRNLWWTGNPIYPAALGPLPGGMPEEHLDRTKLITWLTAPPDGVSHLAELGWDHLNWPYALGIIALAGILSGPVAAARLKRKGDCAHALALLLCMGLIALAAYPFMPFSGTVNGPAQPLRTDLRFLIAPFACGILLTALCGKLGGWWRGASEAGLALAVFVGTGRTFLDLGAEFNSGELAAMAGGGIALGAATALRHPQARLLLHPAAVAVFAALALLRIGSFADMRRDINGLYLTYYGGPMSPVGRAWKVIGEMQAPKRVTVFAPGGYMAYPLLGRNLQHTFVPVTESGTPWTPLHMASSASETDANLGDSLVAQGINLVLISRWDGRVWPAQHAVAESDPRFRKIYDDNYSAVYELSAQ